MKWIAIESARGLEIGVPVLTKDDKGHYWFSQLIKEEKTKDGIVRTFQKAEFPDAPGDQTAYDLVTNITHICIPKP